MAEEPDIILVALRMALAGGIPERVTSLGALGAGDLMSIVARCVALVDTTGGDALPEALPSGVAAKHRACARTASRLKAMGYKGECGYNELLYPGESSTRPLLTWLVDKLPKDGGDAGPGAAPLGGRRARLGEAVRAWTAKRWRLPADRGGFSRGARFRTFAMDDCPLEYAVPSLLEAAATRAVQEARREAALERDADELSQEGGGRCAPLSGSGAVDLGWGTLGEMPSLKELLASLERGTETERARLGRLAHAARFDHGGGDDDAGPGRRVAKASGGGDDEPPADDGRPLKRGARVEARYAGADDLYFRGRVVAVSPAGDLFDVRYDHGETEACVHRSRLRRVSGFEAGAVVDYQAPEGSWRRCKVVKARGRRGSAAEKFGYPSSALFAAATASTVVGCAAQLAVKVAAVAYGRRDAVTVINLSSNACTMLYALLSVLRLARSRLYRRRGRKATAHDTGVEIWRLVEALVIEDDDDKKPAVRDAVELPAIEKKMLEDARDPFEEIEDAEAIRIDFEAESPAKHDLTCGCGPAAM